MEPARRIQSFRKDGTVLVGCQYETPKPAEVPIDTRLSRGLPPASEPGDWICTFHGGHACHILRFLTPSRAAAVHQYMSPIGSAPRRCLLVGTATDWFSKIVTEETAIGLAVLEMNFALV